MSIFMLVGLVIDADYLRFLAVDVSNGGERMVVDKLPDCFNVINVDGDGYYTERDRKAMNKLEELYDIEVKFATTDIPVDMLPIYDGQLNCKNYSEELYSIIYEEEDSDKPFVLMSIRGDIMRVDKKTLLGMEERICNFNKIALCCKNFSVYPYMSALNTRFIPEFKRIDAELYKRVTAFGQSVTSDMIYKMSKKAFESDAERYKLGVFCRYREEAKLVSAYSLACAECPFVKAGRRYWGLQRLF